VSPEDQKQSLDTAKVESLMVAKYHTCKGLELETNG
jgi:hypothetical protein